MLAVCHIELSKAIKSTKQTIRGRRLGVSSSGPSTGTSRGRARASGAQGVIFGARFVPGLQVRNSHGPPQVAATTVTMTRRGAALVMARVSAEHAQLTFLLSSRSRALAQLHSGCFPSGPVALPAHARKHTHAS
jgi:hypothetical protein